MRTLTVLVVLLAAAATVAVVAIVRETGAGAGHGSVTLVGDSLNVGIEPYLARELRGWTIRAHDMNGRTTLAGVQVMRALGGELAPTVVVSLGTNDPQQDAEAFRSLVREVLRLAGTARCVVWVNIWLGTAPNHAFNRALAQEADANDTLRVVEWDGIVSRHPDLLAADGVHATQAGYELRAKAVAAAVRACAPDAR